MNLTKQTAREFLLLVVEKETFACWSWAGDHDADLRPVFRGEKAYRVMYELRIRSVPDGFHVHHKCGNSACVNPRHLVALSPEAHRRVHATKDKAIHERIYHGEWEQIQAAEAEAAGLKMERLERQRLELEERLKREGLEEKERLERERGERLERERLDLERGIKEDEELFAEYERWLREHPWLVLRQRCKWLLVGVICQVPLAAVTYLEFSGRLGANPLVFFAMAALFSLMSGSFIPFLIAFSDRPSDEAYEHSTNQSSPNSLAKLGVGFPRRFPRR
jgi:HNH endonuclease